MASVRPRLAGRPTRIERSRGGRVHSLFASPDPAVGPPPHQRQEGKGKSVARLTDAREDRNREGGVRLFCVWQISPTEPTRAASNQPPVPASRPSRVHSVPVSPQPLALRRRRWLQVGIGASSPAAAGPLAPRPSLTARRRPLSLLVAHFLVGADALSWLVRALPLSITRPRPPQPTPAPHGPRAILGREAPLSPPGKRRRLRVFCFFLVVGD